MSAKPVCQNCRKGGGKPAERINPRNYTVEKKLLCAKCRDKLGYSKPMYPATWGAGD